MTQRKDDERIAELEAENAELHHLVKVLVERADEVFASRAWRIGRAMARIERPFRKLFLGDRRPYRHLEPGYFHRPGLHAANLMLPREAAASNQSRPEPFSALDVPDPEVEADVAKTMNALWAATAAPGRPRGA